MFRLLFPLVRRGPVACAFVFAACLLGQTSVLTQHNDLARTGQNLTETILTPVLVGGGNFGKLFTIAVDGQVYAQPLYMPALTVGGAAHNVVFLATEHDSVFAFDADKGGTPLWKASLLDQAHGATVGATTDPESDSGCIDIAGSEYGITGTPVIDPATGTLYVVSQTYENNYPVQRLHALDVTSGAEKFGGPVTIAASVSGTGSGSTNGVVSFDPKWENQRAGLTLVNGKVYIAYGSRCDFGAFHGWLFAYDAATLHQTSVFLTTPNGEGSGIWMGGAGLSVDTSSGTPRMFVPTGNGSYDATTPYGLNTMDYGDNIVRLDLSNGMNITDAFTPKNQAYLQAWDFDVAGGGVLILPDQPGPNPHLLVQLGKQDAIYLVNRDNMGGYSTSSNNIVQEIDETPLKLGGSPAYWNGNVYLWPGGAHLRQYALSNGMLSATPVASSSQTTSNALGATPAISANGATSGIVWAIDWSVLPEVVYAFDATNVSKTLWSSAANATRDGADSSVKFVVPTVVNGKVYAASSSNVQVYGPLPDFTLSTSAAAVSVYPTHSVGDTVSISPLFGFTGSVVLSASGLPPGVTASFAANNTGAASTMTLSAAYGTYPGIYPVTVTGTSGNLAHSVTVSVTVIGLPDFVISAAPDAISVKQGGTASTRLSLAALNGFNTNATFTISGLPSGVTASFSPQSSATGTVVSFVVPAATETGGYTISITATASWIVHTLPVTLTVTSGGSSYLAGTTNLQLVNKAAGRCADVVNMAKTAGALLGLWDCWGGASQLWNLAAAPIGDTLTSVNSGLVLDVNNRSTSPGANVDQTKNVTSTSQMWTLKLRPDGSYNLVNAKSALCLDLTGGATADSTLLDQTVCAATLTQEWRLLPLNADQTVNLTAAYNVNAIGTDWTPVLNGGIDGASSAYPVGQIGSGYNFYGKSFKFGPENVADGVSSATVVLPSGQYAGLYILGTAVNGSQLNQAFTVNYSDGTSATLTQNMSDWGASQGYANEWVVATAAYKLVGTAEVTTPVTYYGYTMPLDPSKTVVSVVLPQNRNVVILAMTVSAVGP